jgi:hypothetical protein
MIVVMVVGASEAEILGVKSQILAEGSLPTTMPARSAS